MIDPSPPSAVEQRRRSTLVLSGDVDASTTSRLDERFGELRSAHRIDVDMAAVTFMDSSGLRSILTEHQRRRALGDELVVLRPSSAVRRLFDITGLGPHLRVESGRDVGPPLT
jgi:anti-anti-sigma factor